MSRIRALAVTLIVASLTATTHGEEWYQGTRSLTAFHGTFIQWGGTASVANITHGFGQAMHYDRITIHDGLFYSGKIDFGSLNGYAYFTQNGGVHINSNGIVLASSRERFVNQGSWYTMNGGLLQTPHLGGKGSFRQTGGTTVATQFGIAGGGSAIVEGGSLNATGLGVSGIDIYLYFGGSGYALASFRQEGGTVTAEGVWVGGGGVVTVAGGTLAASNVVVDGYVMDGYLGPSGRRRVYASFTQQGGEIVISQRLDVGTKYSLEGGSLAAPTIMVKGQFIAKSSDIINTQRFIMAGGKFDAYASCRLGRLALRTNGPGRIISELGFSAPGVVRFRNSSMEPWTRSAYLVVKGWQGLTNGGGDNQLRFGNGSHGLTRPQLAGIIFEQPSGDYSARILSTGEVVPDAPLGLQITRRRNRMVLAWGEPYYLETTTNLTSKLQYLGMTTNPVGASWLAVTQASPLVINFSEPQRYFRLRR